MRVPWTARRSNQSILKEISPEYSLEGLILSEKFSYRREVIISGHVCRVLERLAGKGGQGRLQTGLRTRQAVLPVAHRL